MKPLGFCIDCGIELIHGEHWVCEMCQAQETLAREENIQ